MKYRNYQHYLTSSKWRKVRKDYIHNNIMVNNHCLFCCAESKLNFHHWKYPNNWNNDCHSNVILVCQECHMKLHDNCSHQNKELSFKDYMGYAIDRIFKCSDSPVQLDNDSEESYEDGLHLYKIKEI